MKNKIESLKNALKQCYDELMLYSEDLGCDHSVGVCACSTKAALYIAAIELGIIKHGINCEKEPHFDSGYLHGEDDDMPYDVDGVEYCGRCHAMINENYND